jgi:hypothetical protein
MFNSGKLDVWQEAIQFADLVYELSGDFLMRSVSD